MTGPRSDQDVIQAWHALVSHPVAGQPALLGFRGRDLAGVLVFTMTNNTIQAVHVIADPRQLGFLSAQLSTKGTAP